MLLDEIEKQVETETENETKTESGFDGVTDVLSLSPDPVMVMGTDCVIREANDEAYELLGYTEGSLEGADISDLLPETDLKHNIDGYLDRPGFQIIGDYGDVDVLRADGTRLPVEISLNPIYDSQTDEDASLERVVVTLKDVSEKKRREERIESANQQLKVLNRVLRHDIRNDMNVVRGRAEALRGVIEGSDCDCAEDCLEHIEPLVETSGNVIDLTQTAREFIEFVSDGDADLETVNLSETVEVEVSNTKSEVDGAVIEAKDGLSEENVCVEADGMLSSVFRNLLNNAVKHNDKKTPVVSVGLEEITEETVSVYVEDNGPGIPRRVRESLFEKGEKGLESGGTGIGLYLVKRLTQKYGGEIDVRNDGSEGSVFSLTLRRTDCGSESEDHSR